MYCWPPRSPPNILQSDLMIAIIGPTIMNITVFGNTLAWRIVKSWPVYMFISLQDLFSRPYISQLPSNCCSCKYLPYKNLDWKPLMLILSTLISIDWYMSTESTFQISSPVFCLDLNHVFLKQTIIIPKPLHYCNLPLERKGPIYTSNLHPTFMNPLNYRLTSIAVCVFLWYWK